MNSRAAVLEETETSFGVHLTIDAYRGIPEKLRNMKAVFYMLDQLPEKLNMKKITTPYVVEVGPSTNGKKDSGGLSGFVMIAESHISIHTFPDIKFASIDIYTCKNNLDTESIISYFKDQ